MQMTLSARIAIAFALIDMVKNCDADLAALAETRVVRAMNMVSMLQDVEVAVLVDAAIKRVPAKDRNLRDVGEVAADLDSVREECVASLRRHRVQRSDIAAGLQAALSRAGMTVPEGLRI